VKLTVIEATNFLSHASSRVELNGGRLSTFSGPNGAGKSALLESLLYVLYDAARGRTDDLVRLGSSEMSVAIEFEFGGSTYRAVRGRSTRAGGKSFLELHVQRHDGAWRPLTAESIRETQALIAELLRLDADTFATAAFLKQGEADRFISATAGDRKRILASVLGLDRYERAEAHARELARGYDAGIEADRRAIESLEAKMVDREQAANDEASSRHALDEYAIEAGLVEVELAEHRTALDGLAAQLAEATAAERERIRLQRDVEARVEDWKAARRRQATAEEQRARAEATLAQAATIEEAVARVPALEAELAAAKEAAEEWRAAEALVEAAQSRHRDAQRDVETAERRLSELEAQRADTTVCPECGATIPAGGQALEERIEAASVVQADARAFAAALDPIPAMPAKPASDPWALQEQLTAAQGRAAGAPALEEARRTQAEATSAIKLATREAAAAEKAGKAARVALDEAEQRVAALAPLRAEQESHRVECYRLEERQREIANDVRVQERLHAAAETRLKAMGEAATERDAIARRIEASALEVALLRRLVTAFGRDGIPARIIESVLPELGRYANELLEQLRPGMALDLRAQRAKRDGGMAEALDLVVRDDAGERGLAMFSGGERMSVALAIAVGLSRLVARRAGTAIRTLVVDEPDGLDVDARRAFGSALRILAHHGDLERVLLVSHHEDLADIGDSIYRVTKDAAGSHVELVS
jgi:exonuclease SbcC